MKVWVLLAYHTIYHSEISWSEFVGVFDSFENVQAAVESDEFIWLEGAVFGGKPFTNAWHTIDLGLGADVRRSFHALEMDINTTVHLFGDRGLKS